jgi:antitoxin StbD
MHNQRTPNALQFSPLQYTFYYTSQDTSAMTRLLTPHIATMTELREPHKVFERSGGKPVAILKNSAVVGYLVPNEAVDQGNHRVATLEEVMQSLERTRAAAQPVLDYLKDK